MNEIWQQIKQKLEKMGKHLVKIILVLALILIILFGGFVYVIKKHDGTYKEDDWSNTQYAASQYTSNTSIDADGNINSAMTAQELWDKMQEEHSRVDLYLDKPEELLKLMNAEIVTNYPDLRENPDEEIDWDKINSNVDSTDVQGIIKFKRAQSNGDITTMSYVDSDTFYEWIELYSTTGDEDARQKALTHFTIEKNVLAGNTSTDTLEYNGSDIVTDISEQIIQAIPKTEWNGPSQCQNWVRRVYANAGLGNVTYPKAVDAYRANVVSTEMDNIPIGAAVYGTGTGSYGAGHVGIYIGNGQVMDSVNDGIRTQSLEEWVAWQENYGFEVDGRTGWLGWGWQAGSPTKIISGGDEDSSNDTDNEDDDSEKISTANMQLITDNGKITFYNGDGSAMEGGKYNAIGYELSDGQVAMKDLQQYKNSVIYIETASSGEGSYANGRFFYVTDTGGGLADNQVDVYAKVDQSTLNAAPYGTYSSGAKIYLVESNVTFEDYNSRYLNKNIGDVSGATQNQNAYSVVVATWNKIEEIVESDDDQVDESHSITYSMSTEKINYQEFVSGYTMPFDYLWDLLVHSQDKDFVLDLADLVYDSDIEITIHDNVTEHTKKYIYNYTRKEKVQTVKVEGEIIYQAGPNAPDPDLKLTKKVSEDSGFEAEEYPTPCKTTKTVITTTNTVDISLTKADVWIVKYEKKYEYQGEKEGKEQSEGVTDLEDVDYGDPSTIHEDRNKDGAAVIKREEDNLAISGCKVLSSSVEATCHVWHGVFEITEEITNKIDTTEYIASPSTIEEKTDKNATEPNFVTILLDGDNRKAKHIILGASDWLFDLLEGNEKTKDMIDITKYLLYKASGNEKYWDPDTPFDFSIYDPDTMTSNSSGSSGIGGIEGQIYDFLLQKGIPPVGAAAIMGNIEGESSFNPSSVNSSGHSGLCQWSPNDRLPKLKKLAESKGKDWTDVEVQLEYLWQELNGSFSKVKNVIMSATQESDLEYATWYFGRHYEIFFIGSWPSSKSNTAKRYEYAQKWYDKWQQNHTSGSGSALAIANGTSEEKLKYLFPNGLPTTASECEQYITTIQVAMTNKNGKKFNGNIKVHKAVVQDVQDVFQTAQNAGFKIYEAGGYAFRRMNNGSGASLSHHSYGIAIDINVNENYSRSGNKIYAGSFWNPSTSEYSIPRDGVLVKAFEAKGWTWGGNWSGSYQDYMHFSFTGH